MEQTLSFTPSDELEFLLTPQAQGTATLGVKNVCGNAVLYKVKGM